MDYEQKKRLFKYITSKDYSIQKEPDNNEILYILFDTFKVKCNYFLLFNRLTNNKNNDNKNIDMNDILWSCDNPYNESGTYGLCKDIKFKIEELKINKTKDIIKYIIKEFSSYDIDDERTELIWIIEDKQKNFSSFYVITEIIYF